MFISVLLGQCSDLLRIIYYLDCTLERIITTAFTEYCVEGYLWTFLLLCTWPSGNILRTKTDFSIDTDQLQLEPTGTSLTFKVKARNDATIALFNNWTHPTEAYELAIGAWGNTRSVLRRKQQGYNFGDTGRNTGPFLDQNAFKEFWARWGNGLISFGTGTEIGNDSILSWKDPNPRAVAMVAIANGYGSDGTWEILQQAANRIKIKTPSEKKYDRTWFSTTTVNKFSFSVKACKNVYLALAQEFGKTSTDTYEIVIGWENSESIIRIIHTDSTNNLTKAILNCNEYRPFWITWRQGFIRVGKGTDIGAEVFLQHSFSHTYTIKAVAISTYRSVGQWQFHKPTVCSDGKWGLHCAFNCSVGCDNVCNGETGTCQCKDGWFGTHCNSSCSSNCVDTRPCDKHTGHCLCIPGYQSPTCDSECSSGYWGAGCTKVCSKNCANKNNCSKIDGTCTCNPGFRGAHCNQTCYDGTFGFNCGSICHCKGGHDDCSKVNGKCASGQCVDGREGVACQMLASGSSPLSIAIGVAVTGIVIVIIVTILIILFLRRRQRRNESPKTENEITLETVSAVTTALPSSKENVHQSLQETTNYENLGIRVADFPDYVRGMQTTENLFKEEYEALPSGLNAPCEVGSTADASKKNRFKNIIAYDHSRVYIEGDTPLTQYINANFINGYGAPKVFIASQGPVKDTVADFIQMLWEQKVPLVVMVTNLEEKGKEKCYRYWPEQISTGSITHRGIVLKKLKEEKFPHFIIRQLELEKENTKHPLTQIQYISWPDHGVPESPAAFLEFHQKAKLMYKPDIGPTVVHCSAGVGRTGTFLAVDYLLGQAKHEGFISINDCVKVMRKDRVNMVQSQDQYVFIHESLLEALHCGKTVYDAVNYEGISSVEKTDLIKQYDMLEKIKPVVSNVNLAFAQNKENQKKNRSQDVLPNSKFRPLLKTNAAEANDYINAVFVHGYQKKHAFIATQSPLPCTVVDIWRLLQDYESNTIIALNETGSEEDCPKYWSSEEGKIGPFSVDTVEETESNGYTRRHLKLKYQDEDRKVKQFQIKSWAPGTLPSATTLLSLYGEVKGWQQESGDSRIIVHCLYGAAETGLYLCLCHVCDKIEREQEVDVFHAVQKIRRSQPLFIPNKEQYEWLHWAAYEYISSFSMYANFK